MASRARSSNFRHGCHRPLLLVLGVLTTTTRSLLPSINAVSRAPSPVCLAKKSAAGKKKTPAPSRGFGSAPAAASKGAKKSSKQQADSPEQASWRAFEDWLAAKGCTADAVELADCGGGLRGLRTTRTVKAGEELLRIPRAIILDEVRAERDVVGAIWRDDQNSELPAYAKLALQVIHEKRLGDASELAPYIALLPTPEELSGYAPAATWADDELSLLECSKVITDAKRLRSRQSGDEHAALEPGALADKWSALSLPGEPPSASELAWAVTVVTSRAYSAEEDGVRLSLMLPMVDMANHMGPAEVTHTVKGLEEDGKSFVVLAKEEIKRHEQVFLSYGGLPNFMLLNQFGFVLPKLVTDVALVNCEDLVAATDAAVLAPIADEGLMMREGGGAIISAWQPAGPALQAGLVRLAETDALPATLVADIETGDSGAEAAATAAYRTLLQCTLDGYSTTIAEDRAALDGGRASLPPRTLLALEFRLTQKTLLNTALATARGNLVGKSRGFA